MAVPWLESWSRNWTYADAPDYTETHELTKSSRVTVVEHQSGTGTAGTFTIEITGTASLDDVAEAAGNYLEEVETDEGTEVHTYASSATGTLTGEVSYTLVVHGRHTPTGTVVDSQTYTETGSLVVARTAFQEQGYSDVSGWLDHERTWSLSWTGQTVNGAWTVTAYAFSELNALTIHTRWDIYDGSVLTQDEDYGSETTATGNGDGTVGYHTREWEVIVKRRNYVNHPEANEVIHEGFGERTIDGTVVLGLGPDVTAVEWKASSPGSVNFSWHGEATYTEESTVTAVLGPGGVSVPAFTLSTAEKAESRLIEDESFVTAGGGTGNYHRNEFTRGSVTVTGSGQYGDTTQAVYQVVETGGTNDHGVLTIIGDRSVGVNEYGEPYDLTFNHTSNRQSSSAISTTRDFEDTDCGLVLLGTTVAGGNGVFITTQHSGTNNGVAFSGGTSSSGGIAAERSEGVRMAEPGDVEGVFPFSGGGGPTAFMSYDMSFIGASAKPLPINAPQEWYNGRVERIGKNAEDKVIKLWFQEQIMKKIFGINPDGTHTDDFLTLQRPAHGTGTFKDDGAAVLKWRTNGKDIQEVIAQAKKDIQRTYPNGTLSDPTYDVLYEYAVDEGGRDPIPPRSGKCVVDFQVFGNWKVTLPNGQVRPIPPKLLGGGLVLFEDDNLKTMTLQP